MDIQVNFLAIIVAAIVDMGIGMFWYSSFGFGKLWMKLVGDYGKTSEEMKREGSSVGAAYVASTLASVVMAFVLANMVKIAGAADYVGAVQTGFWLWLGFIVAGLLPVYIFENRKKGLYLIYIAYKLLSVSAMAVIVTLWA